MEWIGDVLSQLYSIWNIETIKIGLQIIGVFSSLITLYIAVLAFRNFDVKKTFLKDQLKVVSELSNDLSSFGLQTIAVSAGQASTYPRFLDFFNLQGIESYQHIYFNTPNIQDILPFIIYQHNILLPAKIAKAVKSFDNGYLSEIEKNNMPDKYILIKKNSEANTTISNSYHFYIEYDEFKKNSISLILVIEEWLKKYGAKDINFPDHMLRK